MAVEMCAFKLNDSATKEELNAYARRRGFRDVGAMASFAFYGYLDKVHFPYKDQDKPKKTGSPLYC